MKLKPDKANLHSNTTAQINPVLKLDWRYIIFIILSFVISMIARFPFMNHISSNWRSSQTLLTSFWFQKEGISLFHSQLPLYGPSWQVPFEFPIYQALSVLFSNTTHVDLTLSSRIISVTSYYIVAILLLLLCLKFLDSKFLAATILWVFLWLPYTIRYSTEILIDYSSVALALGYILGLKTFMDSPRNLLLFIFTVIVGALGAMVKITTMAITIIPAIFIVLDGIQSWGIVRDDFVRFKTFINKAQKHISSFLMLLAIAVLPLFAGAQWTKFADSIKQTNIFTVWLTSPQLIEWNFGTWEQKTSFANWWKWLLMINNYFFIGGILLIFAVSAIAFLYKMPSKNRSFLGAALTGAILTIFIFFNLYQHDYYYIAISAYMSVLIGFGIYYLTKSLLQQNKTWWIALNAIFFLFVIMKGIEQYKAFQTVNDVQTKNVEKKYIPLAKQVAENTPKNKYIISLQTSWYPDFVLYTERKSLIFSEMEEKIYSCDLLNKYDYRTIVVVDHDPAIEKRLKKVLSCFKSVKLLTPNIYRILH